MRSIYPWKMKLPVGSAPFARFSGSRVLFLLLAALLTGLLSKAQSPLYTHFGTDQGLPSPSVHRVFQDHLGFLWFATDGGLARYDGHTIKTYGVEDGLCENEVFGFFEDHQLRLWIYGLSGCLNYLENGRLHTPDFNSKLREIVKDEAIQSLVVDSFGFIWITLKFRPDILRIDSSGNITHRSTHAQTRFQVQRIGTKHLVFGRGRRARLPEGQERADLSLVGSPSVTIPLMPAGREALEISPSAIVVNDSTLAFAANSFLSIIVNAAQKYGASLPAASTNSLFIDRNQRIWIGTAREGVLCFGDQTLQKKLFHFFRGHTISSVYEDHEGGFWFTSLDDGVFYVRSVDFLKIDLDENAFADVSDIAGDGEEPIFIALRSGTVSRFSFNKNGEPQQEKSWKYDKINDLCYANGKLYIANESTNRGAHWDIAEGHFLFNARKVYAEPGSPQVFVSGGLKSQLLEHTDQDTVPRSIRNLGFENRIYDFQYDGQHKLWLGCLDGLYQYESGKIIHLGHQHPLFNARVSSLDAWEDLFAIGFQEQGIMLFRGNDTLLINEASGLPSNRCNDVVIDPFTAGKMLYVATHHGVSRIALSTANLSIESITHIGADEGLGTNLVHRLYLTPQHLWLATHSGAIYCPKNAEIFNAAAPRVLITGTTINGSTMRLQNHLVLPYDSNDLEFQLVGFSFKTADHTLFHYRLLGADQEWRSTVSPTIRYTRLPPGTYQLEVKAENNSGVLTEQAAVLQVEILPPFWATWWFRTVCIGIFLLLVALFIQYRIALVKNRASLREALNRSRQQALNAQMNPHFLFNSLHSIQQFIMRNDKRSSNYYLTKFASLMRETLRQSDRVLVKLSEDLSLLEIYLELEALRFAGQFDYRIEVSPKINQETTLIPPFLIQPYVENAIWHGLIPAHQGSLVVRIDLPDDYLKIVIQDSGIGINASKNDQSKKGSYKVSSGMRLSQQRIQLLEEKYGRQMRLSVEDLSDARGDETGTRITLELPLISKENESFSITTPNP